MCLILFAWRQHPDYPLIFAANRDEFYDRPTSPAAFWPDAPHVLAGRDLVGRGTWLGLSRDGRLAALSNFRDPAEREREGRSRGLLVANFLRESGPVNVSLEKIARQRSEYRSFNLLAGTVHKLFFYSSRQNQIRSLPPGIYGLSNHLLDTPWPKVVRGREALARVLERGGKPPVSELFALLADTRRAPEQLLPDTGVGLEWESILSPLFIVSPLYGTRSSTVLLIDQNSSATFVERTFRGSPERWGEVRQEFLLESGPAPSNPSLV
jgi:uncharacterized protein with NRDE domain